MSIWDGEDDAVRSVPLCQDCGAELFSHEVPFGLCDDCYEYDDTDTYEDDEDAR